MRVLVVGLALAGLVAACGQPPAPGEGGARPVVVTSTTVFADIIGQVAGEAFEVRSLVGVGGDPHTFEPRPSDAVAVSEAALVVDGGLGLSPWLQPLLATREGPVLDLGATAAEIARESAGTLDPHVWMVPTLVADRYLPGIEAALAELAPDEADGLATRADALAATLAGLDAEIRDTLDVVPSERRLLITSHDAYGYFAEAYDLDVVGTVVGVSTEEEPSAQTIAALIDQIAALDVPAVFIESTVSPQVIQRIAADAGVEVGAPLYGDSLGPEGSGAETYADMLRTNARSLAEGLR